ncbi:UBA/TS-N domain-containing protein [Coccidioides immitis RS]|uniref:UBA/TS-N domain-containing protein n=1 Tax=Coccidioides immitis (strain RS) TaxID=246410 RepID=J3K8L7_COCIM|nr:UBA/TS-N domain-containing protein [Coccidioides immitis RS]EAS31173.3 UBA/TS-N domain-containing protein [Coccidioides immitis RS]
MDDLSGFKWTDNGNSGPRRRPPMASNAHLPISRPTPPISGRSTPLSGLTMRSGSPSKPSAPPKDSFASLVSFGAGASGKNISLAERQRQLAEQKALEEQKKRAQLEAQYGGSNEQFWDSLGQSGLSKGLSSGLARPSSGVSGQPLPGGDLSRQGPGGKDDEDDILAAFNASAPVDKSTNFPVPSSTSSPAPNAALQFSGDAGSDLVLEDDDPFGLGQMSERQTQPRTTPQQNDDDDDILGPLAKPVSEFAKPVPENSNNEPGNGTLMLHDRNDSPPRTTPVDRAIAELVDMGFPIEKASQALSTTESGTDVQAAVSWLLNQAHAEAREKARGRSQSAQAQPRSGRAPDRHRELFAEDHRDSSLPTRVRDQHHFEETSRIRRQAAEKDAAQLAAEFGSNLFKSANSLWKSGTKKVQQAVQEFNSNPDPNQPRWMREEALEFRSQTIEVRQQRSPTSATTTSVTDEALMLEMQRAPPSRSPQPPPHITSHRRIQGFSPSRQLSPRPRQLQQDVRNTAMNDTRPRLSRLTSEEQASQAYISPARRRKPPPQSHSEVDPDLLGGSHRPPQPARPAHQSPPSQPQRPTGATPSPPVAPRPKPPPRQIPSVSTSALLSSHKHRQDGTAAFKRGDYAAAHAAYSTAISLLPSNHPVTIILLTNHALTALKIGEPKTAISDADRALSIIGPSKGELEQIDLGNGEPMKEMREFFGKAMMRKAEALEQLEKWTDAAKIWQETVESGHGGSASIQGRTRCEKAGGIRSIPAPIPKSIPSARAPPRTTHNRASKPAIRSQPSVPAKPAEAVSRLRAANEAADRLDNERFALADSVDARLTSWKGGKQDNLRALLASLDTILWAEAGWKKISMAELVLPNKVKIHYMKGIAKVHPDKIPVNATTEQRMIAGAVFSALNEAWDKFKQENGL